MWLCGLGINPQRVLLVRFPVRAHAWVTGQVPSVGRAIGNRSMFLSLSFFLPPSLTKDKISFKKRTRFPMKTQILP